MHHLSFSPADWWRMEECKHHLSSNRLQGSLLVLLVSPKFISLAGEAPRVHMEDWRKTRQTVKRRSVTARASSLLSVKITMKIAIHTRSLFGHLKRWNENTFMGPHNPAWQIRHKPQISPIPHKFRPQIGSIPHRFRPESSLKFWFGSSLPIPTRNNPFRPSPLAILQIAISIHRGHLYPPQLWPKRSVSVDYFPGKGKRKRTYLCNQSSSFLPALYPMLYEV